MAKAVFTTRVRPSYDDLPEERYHFPRTYLNQVQAAVGDWIVYYEPRRIGERTSGPPGRQAYFATARVNATLKRERASQPSNRILATNGNAGRARANCLFRDQER